MFSSTTISEHYRNSIGIRPMQQQQQQLAAKWKYNNVEVAPNCPRCASSNTKFCYYNNYSLSQPRYFCKACRRYWTKGGSLRNVPVGGGCRKSRRARAASCRPQNPTPPSADGSNNGGACIDMAAVFANYVNQNLESDDQSSSFSTGSSSDNVQAGAFDVDSQFEDINNSALGWDPVVPQASTCQDLSGQQLVYQDFELQQQGVLCDDELWAEGTTLPNLPMVQEEDCGLLAADYDQLRISANLVSDNWGSFDLSAYDFYSTP